MSKSSIKAGRKEKSARKKFAEGFKDKQLVIDVCAEDTDCFDASALFPQLLILLLQLACEAPQIVCLIKTFSGFARLRRFALSLFFRRLVGCCRQQTVYSPEVVID